MMQRDGSIIRMCDQGGSDVTMQQMSAATPEMGAGTPEPSSNTQRKFAGKQRPATGVVVAARKSTADEQR